MKYSEICSLSSHELKGKIIELVKELSNLQLKKSISASTTKDTSVFKKLRKSIAQMKMRLSLNV